MLSDATIKRLKRAEQQQFHYTPGDQATNIIKQKNLIMVVGPSSVGKTFIMNDIITKRDDAAMVVVFTTRGKRADDYNGQFIYYEHNDQDVNFLLDAIEQRAVVQYAIHPTSGRIYGTFPDGLPANYNLLATLSNTVEYLRGLPFNHTATLGIIVEPSQWDIWFDKRFAKSSPERLHRLKEATMSLEWLLSSPEDTIKWVINHTGNTDELNLNELLSASNRQPEGREAAKILLNHIKSRYHDEQAKQ